LILNENLDFIDRQIQAIKVLRNLENCSNVSFHIVIQRSILSFSELIQLSLFEQISPLLLDFKLTWAESEGVYINERVLRD
jgi:hypothetical protein